MQNWDKIYKYLEGTCHSVGEAIDYFNLQVKEEDVEEEMLNMNLEPCPICGWWTESGELIDDDGNIVGCWQCRRNVDDSE